VLLSDIPVIVLARVPVLRARKHDVDTTATNATDPAAGRWDVASGAVSSDAVVRVWCPSFRTSTVINANLRWLRLSGEIPDFLVKRVEAIGRNSNLADIPRKWSDLRERVKAFPLNHLQWIKETRRSVRNDSPLKPQDIVDIMTQYEASDTTQQIGTRYGISKTRVATILREQGVTSVARA
jgi:hypothetical protein